jgi:hypothetical protein
MVARRPHECKGRPALQGFCNSGDRCTRSSTGSVPGAAGEVRIGIEVPDCLVWTSGREIFEAGEVLLFVDPEEIFCPGKWSRDSLKGRRERREDMLHPEL